MQRRSVPVRLDSVNRQAIRVSGYGLSRGAGPGLPARQFICPGRGHLRTEKSRRVSTQRIRAGGRFLDIWDGLAPDKLTAEVRKLQLKLEGATDVPRLGRLEWSASLDAPFQSLWTYHPPTDWKYGQPIDRVLLWPEVDRGVTRLPVDCRRVFVRYRLQGNMALDSVRLAVTSAGSPKSSQLQITRHPGDGHGGSFSFRTHLRSDPEPCLRGRGFRRRCIESGRDPLLPAKLARLRAAQNPLPREGWRLATAVAERRGGSRSTTHTSLSVTAPKPP